jgi:MFS family permease
MRGMKPLLGLLYGLAGMAAGFVLGAVLAMLYAQFSHASNREGAVGYLAIAIGIIGALIGLGVGLWWYARSAPPGEGLAQLFQGVAGVIGLVAVLVLGGWAWMQSREVPATYDGDTQAQLLLEFRLRRDALPAAAPERWLNVEVTTPGTRPEALVLWDQQRTEAEHVVLPAVQGPLIRSGRRLIVARLRLPQGGHDELFSPPMPRKPDPRADWSEWHKPQQVYDGDAPSGKASALLEMRWKLRLYGE